MRLGRRPPRATTDVDDEAEAGELDTFRAARRRTEENFNDAYEHSTRSTQGRSASLSITKPIPPRCARGRGDPAGRQAQAAAESPRRPLAVLPRLVCRGRACVQDTGQRTADARPRRRRPRGSSRRGDTSPAAASRSMRRTRAARDF